MQRLAPEVELLEAKLGDALLAAFHFQQDLGRCQKVGDEEAERSAIDKARKKAHRNLGALYKKVVASKSSRTNFLKSMLRPFAQHLTDAPGAAGFLPYLSFLARVGAVLPFAKEDGPLAFIHQISPLVTQHADPIQAAMDALKGKQVATGAGSGEDAVKTQLLGLGQKAAAVALLLLLKRHLQTTYNLSDSKILTYNPTEKKQFGFRGVAAPAKGLDARGLPVGAGVDKALKQCKIFKKLLREAEAQLASGQLIKTENAKHAPDEPAAASPAPLEATPEATPDAAAPPSGGATGKPSSGKKRTRRSLYRK